ncbi:hypothetical protein HDU82_003006, partial [Entophlyctis luteolus]
GLNPKAPRRKNMNPLCVAFIIIAAPTVLIAHGIFLTNITGIGHLPPSSFLIVWLCFFDGVIALNNLIVSTKSLISGKSEGDDPTNCSIHGFVTTFAAMTSVLLCFGITLFRYLAIVRRVNIKESHIGYLIAIVIFALLFTVPPFPMNRGTVVYAVRPSQVHCAAAWYSKDYIVVVGGGSCLSVTLVFMSYAYFAIFVKVREILGKEMTRDLIGRLLIPSKGFDVSDEVKFEDAKRVVPFQIQLPNELSKNCEVPTSGLQTDAAERGLLWKEQMRKQFDDDCKLQIQLLKQAVAIVLSFLCGWVPYFI